MLRFGTVIDFFNDHWFLGMLTAGVVGFLSSCLVRLYYTVKYRSDTRRWKYEEQERINEQKHRRP